MHSNTAVLQYKLSEKSWTNPSPAIWAKILSEFVFELADSFSLSGIRSISQLQRQTVFHFAYQNPPRELRQTTEKEFRTVGGQHSSHDVPLAVFELSESAKSALQFAPFAHYSFDPDFQVYDYLTFYLGAAVFATVDADMSTVCFPELNRDWYQWLIALDPTIADNLWMPGAMVGTNKFQPQD